MIDIMIWLIVVLASVNKRSSMWPCLCSGKRMCCLRLTLLGRSENCMVVGQVDRLREY